MTDGVRETEADPPAALLAAVDAAVRPWLVRCVVDTAARQWGRCPDELRVAAEEMAAREGDEVVAAVGRLLATDVDEQRGTPLAVLRAAVAAPTSVLTAAGVPPARRDEFAEQTFPDDAYGLAPATWGDVDPALHEPGLVWGAWKAATVLHRRRQEGRR